MWIFQLRTRSKEDLATLTVTPSTATIKDRQTWNQTFDDYASKVHPEWGAQGKGVQADKNYESLRELYVKLTSTSTSLDAAVQWLCTFTDKAGVDHSVLDYYNLSAGQMAGFVHMAQALQAVPYFQRQIQDFDEGESGSGGKGTSVMRYILTSLHTAVQTGSDGASNADLNARFNQINNQYIASVPADSTLNSNIKSFPTGSGKINNK